MLAFDYAGNVRNLLSAIYMTNRGATESEGSTIVRDPIDSDIIWHKVANGK